jgi:hypothetical protein
MVSAASWPIRHRPAPCSDTADAPEKRKPMAALLEASILEYQVKACCLTYDALEPSTHDAGAEHASSASHHPFCDSRPMLRAKSFGCLDNGARGGTEPINESAIIGRSVIGTFGESSGNCNWTYSNRANIRPELVFVLHLLLHSPTRSQETARASRQPQHHNRTRAPRCSALALTRHTPYWPSPGRRTHIHGGPEPTYAEATRGLHGSDVRHPAVSLPPFPESARRRSDQLAELARRVRQQHERRRSRRRHAERPQTSGRPHSCRGRGSVTRGVDGLLADLAEAAELVGLGKERWDTERPLRLAGEGRHRPTGRHCHQVA